jgi:hypothetical protein
MKGSAAFGKTKKQIEKLMADGKVTADEGTKAILEIVSDKIDHGGPLGTLSKQLGEGTVEGQLQALKNQMSSVFADSAVTGPFIDALKSINKLLDPTTETGAKIRATLGRAFEMVGNAVSSISPDQIEKVLNAAISLTGTVMDLAGVFSSAFKKAIGPALEPLMKMFDGSKEGSKTLEALGTVLQWVAQAFGMVAGAVGGTFLNSMTMVLGLPGKLQSMWENFDLSTIGTDIVDGLWEGIKSGWKTMLEKVEGLLDLLPDVAKKALGMGADPPTRHFDRGDVCRVATVAREDHAS